MSSALLALWIALIGADRIDLAGGHGPFILTPFLALTPIVVISEIIRRTTRGEVVTLSRRAIGYGAASAALLCVTLASAILSQQVPVSAARIMLLVGDIAGTFAVAVLCADRRDFARVLATGAMASLVMFVAFDVAEALYWIGRGPEMVRLGPMSMRFDQMQSLGPIPRLPGPVGDGNRAGFVLVAYAFFIAAGEPRVWLRRSAVALAIVLLVLPLSRSATLASVATVAIALLSRRRGPSLRLAATAALMSALVAAFFVAEPGALGKLTAVVSSPVTQRLSTTGGSAQSHVALIERGIGEGMESIPRAAIGLGYGSGYLVLQDIFPGNRYGNFHSLYVTMFAESGIFALLLTLVLMGAPLVLGGPWRPLVAGALAFNVFYQTTTEPVFWFVLAIAWLTIPAGAFSARAVDETAHRPFRRPSR